MVTVHKVAYESTSNIAHKFFFNYAAFGLHAKSHEKVV